jgi:hypothetical protein
MEWSKHTLFSGQVSRSVSHSRRMRAGNYRAECLLHSHFSVIKKLWKLLRSGNSALLNDWGYTAPGMRCHWPGKGPSQHGRVGGMPLDCGLPPGIQALAYWVGIPEPHRGDSRNLHALYNFRTKRIQGESVCLSLILQIFSVCLPAQNADRLSNLTQALLWFQSKLGQESSVLLTDSLWLGNRSPESRLLLCGFFSKTHKK